MPETKALEQVFDTGCTVIFARPVRFICGAAWSLYFPAEHTPMLRTHPLSFATVIFLLITN